MCSASDPCSEMLPASIWRGIGELNGASTYAWMEEVRERTINRSYYDSNLGTLWSAASQGREATEHRLSALPRQSPTDRGHTHPRAPTHQLATTVKVQESTTHNIQLTFLFQERGKRMIISGVVVVVQPEEEAL